MSILLELITVHSQKWSLNIYIVLYKYYVRSLRTTLLNFFFNENPETDFDTVTFFNDVSFGFNTDSFLDDSSD